MQSYDPKNKYDREEAARLGAPPWMLEALKANPGYCWAGQLYHGDRADAGWEAPMRFATWAEVELEPDDLNIVADFFFEIERDAKNCEACGGQGYNPATRRIADAFYRHSCPPGMEPWNDKITEDEVDALWKAKRLFDFKKRPPAEEVNAAQALGIGHDAINRGILVETRARRLGAWGETGHCDTCKGHGHVYTAPAPRLTLVLWVLHPRKGAARTCSVESVEKSDLSAVRAFLRKAAAENAKRFAGVARAGRRAR